jgi:DNA polymerase V
MSIFALVDCNNFYASCERVFNPALEGKPIVILSNNDGCIIARSNEAKALGIPMGCPYYSFKQIFQKQNVEVFSSNYELYGDMSQRVMDSLAEFCPDIEVYSIDEAFLKLDGFKDRDLDAFAIEIRQKIKQWTGIPVSIGIGATKTLAKMANHIAKRHTQSGVFNLLDTNISEKILSEFEVEKIWGIASGGEKKLKQLGIITAKQLRDANPKIIRKHLTVVGERIVYELRGISCLPLEIFVAPKKNIMSSRSFGRIVTKYEDLEEAIANYASRACEKMRKEKSRAQAVQVSVTTNPFKTHTKQYRNGTMSRFIAPTNDTMHIISQAVKCLKQIYHSDYEYKKVSVMLMDLVSDEGGQQDLFDEVNYDKSDKIMGVLDNINLKMGRNKLFIGTQGIERNWKMQRNKQSSRFTTQWHELLEVR